MVIPNQRDPDSTDIIRQVRAGLADLKATMISRWGRVPHVTVDPTSPPDGAVWIRSDLAQYRYRANGVTITSSPLGTLGVHTLPATYTTTGTHTTLQDDGLSVTANDVAGRRLQFSLVVNPFVSGGANGILYALLRDGVSIRQWLIPTEAMSTTVQHSITFTHVELLATTHAASVYKVQAAATPTNTAVQSFGSATYPRQLIIQDIGT